VGGEEGGKYEEDNEPVVAAAALPALVVKGKSKAAPKKGGGSRGPKWRSVEDECLAEAFKTVSIDPISGANQNSDTYWERVKVSFDECKLMDPTFNKCTWITTLPRCLIVGESSNKLATSGMESNKRSWIGKKAE
jgi:hypothetical protein